MIGFETSHQAAPGPARDTGSAFLEDIIESDGSQSGRPTDAALDRLLALARAWRPPREAPPDLVGRACAKTPPEWHLASLLALAGRPDGNCEAERAQRLYHARWLAHLLMPDRAEFRPRVTVLIPAYNRAAMAVEAVESCLAQSWRPLEILVIDDGSTDDLARALARFGDAVRLHRQPNGGVSCARNAGMRLATGDFVHFLDSDNLLLPTAVARKVDGFARIPDAELCYSLAELSGARSPDTAALPAPDGSANCPTTSLLASWPRYPFYVSCTMLPRFTLLASDGFEEDLRRAEDVRLWIKLALRDTKVIGLATKLTIRRLSPGSLSAAPIAWPVLLLMRSRTAADFLGQQRTWPLALRLYPALLRQLAEDEQPTSSDAAHPGIQELVIAIRTLGAGGAGAAISPLPMLARMREQTRRALCTQRAIAGHGRAMLEPLLAAIEDASLAAAPLRPADLPFWLASCGGQAGQERLHRFLERADSLARRHPSLLRYADELLRRAAGIPGKVTLRRYVRLRRCGLPPRVSHWLARRSDGLRTAAADAQAKPAP